MGASKEMFMQEREAESHESFQTQRPKGFIGGQTQLHYQCQELLFGIQKDKIKLMAAKARLTAKAEHIPEEFRADSEQWKEAYAEYNACRDVLLQRHWQYNEIIKIMADDTLQHSEEIVNDKPAALTNGELASCQ